VIRTPALYMLAFFLVFLIGGMTGVMLAVIPFDRQVHDTFFVVAHFHYVLIGGAVFPLLGAVHYWFPKFTGRMLSERLGAVAFVLFFIGFNTAFFPQHILGLYGMPRRVYSYAAETGWGPLNLLSTGGAAVMAIGILVYLINVLVSLRSGTAAGDNPWHAPTLEWATSSPPPPYNFEPIPTVGSLYPLWEPDAAAAPVITGLKTDEREVLVTHVLDAELDHRYRLPDPNIWPFITAVTVTVMFIWSIFSAWGAVYGSIPIVLALTAWTWPRHGMPPAEADRLMRPAAQGKAALS
jgi:cytochrome c oxidase subunit 1